MYGHSVDDRRLSDHVSPPPYMFLDGVENYKLVES